MTQERSEPVDLDELDLQILALLQNDARLSNAEVARRVGLSTSAVYERVRQLREQRVIQAFETRIDPHALGLMVTAFVFIEATEIAREDEVERALLAMPEVLEIHKVAGEDAFIAKVRAPDNYALGRLLRDGVEEAGVRSIRTTIVLDTARERQTLPLPGQP